MATSFRQGWSSCLGFVFECHVALRVAAWSLRPYWGCGPRPGDIAGNRKNRPPLAGETGVGVAKAGRRLGTSGGSGLATSEGATVGGAAVGWAGG